MTYPNCPNCQAPIKSGIFNSNELAVSSITRFINSFTDSQSPAYCEKCQQLLFEQGRSIWQERSKVLNMQIEELAPLIPVITLQVPHNWIYTIVDMVTAQSVTGTGAVSEFTSSWTDLFGIQSNRYNSKIKNGESRCKNDLRLSALAIGANAVIATDIDYTEVGGDKGMLMVCMSGTAVKLQNAEILGESMEGKFQTLTITLDELKHINSFKTTPGLENENL